MGLFDSMLEKGKGFSDLNRYVDDYRIVEISDRRGRMRKRAVYTGVWTVLRSAREKWKLWAALALSAILAAAYARMLLLPHMAGGQLLVMAPLLVGLFPLLYLLMGCLSLPFRGGPMRRDQYMHSFIRACRSAVAVGCFAAAGLAASLMLRLIRGDWLYLAGDWQFTVSCAAIPCLSWAVVALLRGVDLAERENAAFESRPM